MRRWMPDHIANSRDLGFGRRGAGSGRPGSRRLARRIRPERRASDDHECPITTMSSGHQSQMSIVEFEDRSASRAVPTSMTIVPKICPDCRDPCDSLARPSATRLAGQKRRMSSRCRKAEIVGGEQQAEDDDQQAEDHLGGNAESDGTSAILMPLGHVWRTARQSALRLRIRGLGPGPENNRQARRRR